MCLESVFDINTKQLSCVHANSCIYNIDYNNIDEIIIFLP